MGEESAYWTGVRELKREFSAALDEFAEMLRRQAAGEDVGDELQAVARRQRDLNARVQEYVSARRP